MKHVQALLVALLSGLLAVAGCAPSLSPAPDVPDAGARLHASVDAPMPGEHVSLTGSTGVSGSRTVVLERRAGSRWVRAGVEPVVSAPSGRFTFPDVEASRSETLRARTTGSGDAVVTNAVALELDERKQRGTLKVLPQIAGSPSSQVGTPADASNLVQAAFAPARPGREVTFEARDDDGEWRSMGRDSQDGDGRASMVAADADAFDEWRVTAAAADGLDEVAVTRTARGWSESFVSDFDGGAAPEWAPRLPLQWLASGTCGYIDPDAVAYSDGVAQLSTRAHNRPPRDMEGTAPQQQVHEETCRDATGVARYFASSMIVSQQDGQLFSFVHGVAAARVKFDRRRGQHAAFWLQTNEPEDTEIDVVESYGESERPLSTGLHVTREDGSTRPFQIRISDVLPNDVEADWYDEFHVFSVEWTPDEYVFRIDGVETFRTRQGASSSPHFVILSNFAADWEIPLNNGEPATMEVDWVRVWQRPGTGGDGSSDPDDEPTSSTDATLVEP